MTDPLKYRGLALQCCMCKILSSVLNNRLLEHMENGHLEEEQNGFRRGRSCQHHVYALTSLIREKLNENKSIYGLFVDFRKAFDVVDRDLLFYILKKKGVGGLFLEIIERLYMNTMNMIKINNLFTPTFNSKQGIRQGDNLSPNLFCSYIDGLLVELNKANIGMELKNGRKVCVLVYADDIVILCKNEQELEKAVKTLQSWCAKWRVMVNVKKTKIVHFRKRTIPQSSSVYRFNNEIIEYVDGYRYLGVYLPFSLDMTETIEIMSKAGSRALGQLISKTKCNFELGYQSYTKLFNTSVVPVLDYGVGAWVNQPAVNNFKKIDNVQNRAIRYFCGLPKSCPIAGLTGDMGWDPGIVRRDLEALRLYNQIIEMPETRLTRQIYENEKLLMNPNSWCANVKAILMSVNMIDKWTSNLPVNLKVAKTLLMELYVEAWKAEIEMKSKLEIYGKIKKQWRVENYVKLNLDKMKRSLICQIRNGILPLYIETDRSLNLSRYAHICKLCKNCVETEYHFLFECVELQSKRMTLYHKNLEILNYCSNIDKLNFLLTKPYVLGNYIYVLWQERTVKLNNAKVCNNSLQRMGANIV